jgi:hypothetical protein
VNRRLSRVLFIGIITAGLFAAGGCEAPRPKFTTHPPGTLPVHYEEASTPTSCLVASAVMAANYLLGQPRFTEPGVRKAMKEQRLDETQVTEMQTFLVGQGLDLIALSGRLDGKPTLGLRFWVERKGYPVICIINRLGEEPKFNHAVVVTGFSEGAGSPPADIVYYLDPSTREPLQSVPATEFEKYWHRGNNTMLLVVAPPAAAKESSSSASSPAGELERGSR